MEESIAELEESQRKLVVLQLQRHGSLMDVSAANNVNGGVSTDKSSDKSMSWQELKDAVEEAKVCIVIRTTCSFLGLITHYPFVICMIVYANLLSLIVANWRQTLASNRLFELHETQEDNLILSKELGDLEVRSKFSD